MAIGHLEVSLHQLHQCRFLRSPEGTLRVLRAIRLVITYLKRIHPSRSFRCSKYRKLACMAFRYLETSLHRLKQSRFSRHPEGRLSSQGHSPA
jgi:hypothetical protein